MRMKKIFIFFILPFSILSTAVQSQTLEDAKKWVQEGRFAESLPVFQGEYQNNSDNASINQWLGVCLYETGRIREAEKYLKFAAEKKIPEAYIYLGKLYTKVYRFDEAEEEFVKYQRINRRNEEALNKLAAPREYAAKLQKLVNRTEDIQIIDSLVVPKTSFLQAYNLGKSSGSLLPLNDFFETLPQSGKTLYMNGKQDKIYYSKNDDTGIDLFTMDKLIDAFGNEKKLPQTINEEGDQAYPFVMNDGLTIYFASTGHESLGGYDLYVTRYNLSADSYLTPNQLNMPFNSPFNDYLMVIDEEKGLGWFASDRLQSADSVCVYTFLPNTQVTLFESDQPRIMSNRARISSIADTRKPDVDYAALREVARKKAEFRQEEKGDFLFVINDNTDYHTLSDFRSDNARSIFSQSLGLEEQQQKLTADLAIKREQYAKGNNNESLRSSILDMEKEVDQLLLKIQRLKREARNEELGTQK